MDPNVFASKLRTYDDSMDYRVFFYDNLPYVRNWNLCNESTVMQYSGNVIKFFQYKVNEPALVKNKDEITALYLQRLQDDIDSSKAVTVSDSEYEKEEWVDETNDYEDS